MKRGRRIDPVDIAVGQRARDLRRAAGLTQQQVASALGVTFQQVQKYEKGANRIAPARLMALAAVTGVPVSTFFAQVEAKVPRDRSRMERLIRGGALDAMLRRCGWERRRAN